MMNLIPAIPFLIMTVGFSYMAYEQHKYMKRKEREFIKRYGYHPKDEPMVAFTVDRNNKLNTYIDSLDTTRIVEIIEEIENPKPRPKHLWVVPNLNEEDDKPLEGTHSMYRPIKHLEMFDDDHCTGCGWTHQGCTCLDDDKPIMGLSEDDEKYFDGPCWGGFKS